MPYFLYGSLDWRCRELRLQTAESAELNKNKKRSRTAIFLVNGAQKNFCANKLQITSRNKPVIHKKNLDRHIFEKIPFDK